MLGWFIIPSKTGMPHCGEGGNDTCGPCSFICDKLVSLSEVQWKTNNNSASSHHHNAVFFAATPHIDGFAVSGHNPIRGALHKCAPLGEGFLCSAALHHNSGYALALVVGLTAACFCGVLLWGAQATLRPARPHQPDSPSHSQPTHAPGPSDYVSYTIISDD